jgi:hypothetical protein
MRERNIHHPFASQKSDWPRYSSSMFVRNSYTSIAPNSWDNVVDLSPTESTDSSGMWLDYDVNDSGPVWEHYLSIGDNKMQDTFRKQKRKVIERQQATKIAFVCRSLVLSESEKSNCVGATSQKEWQNKETEVHSEDCIQDSSLDEELPKTSILQRDQMMLEKQEAQVDTQSIPYDESCMSPKTKRLESEHQFLESNVAEGVARACLVELSTIVGGAAHEWCTVRPTLIREGIPENTTEEIATPANSSNLACISFLDSSQSSSPRSVLFKSNSEPAFCPKTALVAPSAKSAMKRCVSVDANSICGNQDGCTWKRSVSFSQLQIREYTSIEISDNPSCSDGPPIQLGWEYSERTISVDVDQYEQQRSPRRKLHQMLLPYHVRRYLLLYEGGFSNAEISRAVRDVERVKEERKSSKHKKGSTSCDVTFSRADNDYDDDEDKNPIEEVVHFFCNVFRLWKD